MQIAPTLIAIYVTRIHEFSHHSTQIAFNSNIYVSIRHFTRSNVRPEM